MTSQSDLIKKQLDIAEKYLTVLEEQAAGYTTLTIPPALKLDLDEMRRKVADLRAKLGVTNQENVKDVFYIPRRSLFVGRVDETENCLKALTPEDRTWGVMIDGTGGIGKTAFAIEIAYKAREKKMFDAYIYASAKTTWLTVDGIHEEKLALSSLDAFVRETALQLGYEDIGRISNSEERSNDFLIKIRNHRALIIWDNLETLSKEENDKIVHFLRKLPDPNKALVTSRRRTSESGAVIIRLDKLSKQETIALIKGREDTSENLKKEILDLKRNSLDDLYNVSGGNPLLILQILGLISQKGYSISVAINLLRDAEKSKDAYAFLFSHAANALSDEEKSVLSTLAFQKFATIDSIKVATNLSTSKVEASLDTLVKLSLVNDPLDGKYVLHSLITNYVQMILRQEIPSQNTQLGNITLDPDANTRMLSYWVEFAKENNQNNSLAYSIIHSEWPNLEATAIALYEMIGLPLEVRDNNSARQLLDLALALCDRNAPLFALGYWDESVKLAHWGFQVAQKIKRSSDAVKLAEYIAHVYSLRDQVDNINTLNEQLHDLDILSESSKPSTISRSRASLKEIKRLLLSSPKEKIKLEKEVLDSAIDAGDVIREAQIRTELAVLYLEKNDHESADKELDKALQIAKRANDKYLQARILNVMGDRAIHKKPYFIDIVIAPLFDKIDFNNLNLVLQVVYIVSFLLLILPVMAIAAADWWIEGKLRGEDVLGNPQKAFEYYQNASALASSVDAKYELANSKLGMAGIYLQDGNKLDAKECATVALDVYERLSLKRKTQEAKKIIESANKQS